MPLVNMKDMLYHAYENNYSVGAFDLVSLDFLEAVVEAAESSRSAVILSIAEPHFAYYDFELMLSAVETAAKRASVPIAIQLDHGSSLSSITQAINLGCNCVMLDASDQDLFDNIDNTKEVVDVAHQCGVAVVGELGYVAGKDNEQSPKASAFTLPSEAKAYVEKTGVDFLAVSIGTVQGRVNGKVKLDIARLKQLKQAVNVPLVIHGGSGLNEDQFHKLTSNGVAKIDYYTALSDVAAKAMKKRTKDNPNGSFIELKQDVKTAVGKEVKRCLKLWGSAGRAAEILEQCEPWVAIEHLIIHNGSMLAKASVQSLMEEGKNILSAIPGVRDIFLANAMQQKDSYQYCWSIRFTHQSALESFHKNKQFDAFLQKQFKPNVSETVCIDYEEANARL